MGTSGFVVRKTSVIDFATIAVTAFHNLTGMSTGAGPFAPQGVDIEDASIGTGFFIGVDNASFGNLMLRRVSNPGGTPTISANIPIAVTATAPPITVRHLGNLGGANGQLDGGDDRLTSASLVNGRLWTAHTIGVTHTGQASGSANRDGVRWYEIASLTTTPTVDAVGDAVLERRRRQLRSAQLLGAVDRDLDDRPHGHRLQRRRHAASLSTPASPSASLRRAPARFGAAQLYTGVRRRRTTRQGTPGSPTRGRRWGGVSSTVVDGCDGSTIWTLQQFTDADRFLRAAGRPYRWSWRAHSGQRDPSVIRQRGRVDRPAGHRDVEWRHRFLRSGRRIPLPDRREHSGRHRQQRDAYGSDHSDGQRFDRRRGTGTQDDQHRQSRRAGRDERRDSPGHARSACDVESPLAGAAGNRSR